jgi:hypothetical protein
MNAKIEVGCPGCFKSPTMSKLNVTSMLLFMQSQVMQSLPLAMNSLPHEMFQKLQRLVLTTPKLIPLEAKFGIFLVLFIVSYISHRSYLHAKVIVLQKTADELYKAVAILESQHEHLKNIVSYNERLAADVADKTTLLYTNITYLQKALYKKLDLEDKYREGKKEGATKNRQQAIQEYATAKRLVARCFNES